MCLTVKKWTASCLKPLVQETLRFKSLEEMCTRFIASGGYILNITQCNAGKVQQGKYETSSMFEKVGVIGGNDLTTEAAVTKMMVALGMKDKQAVLNMLSSDLRGEMSI